MYKTEKGEIWSMNRSQDVNGLNAKLNGNILFLPSGWAAGNRTQCM